MPPLNLQTSPNKSYIVLMENSQGEPYLAKTEAVDMNHAIKNVTSQWPRSSMVKAFRESDISKVPNKRFCCHCGAASPVQPE